MQKKNPRYRAIISAEKAGGDGATTMASGGLVGVLVYALIGLFRQRGQVPWDEGADEVVLGAAVGVGSGCFQAFKRWRRNRKKHRMEDVTQPSYSSMAAVLLCIGLALGGLAGCKTITAADGTVTQQVDTERALSILREVYFTYVMEQQRLADEEVRADARDEATRQARLAELERLLGPIRDSLLKRGAQYLQDGDGEWVSVRTGKVLQTE